MSHLRVVRVGVVDSNEEKTAVDAGPFGVQLQEDIGARAVDMLEEWIHRYKRARFKTPNSEHSQGRAEAYLQTVAWMLDLPVKEVREALDKGEL